MPKRKEMEASEDDDEYKSAHEDQHDSDEEVENEKESSKQNKKEERDTKRKKQAGSSSNNPKEHIFELSTKRRVRVGVFPKGMPFVDIRDVYNDKETGELKWGGKGICLPLAQYEKLKELLSEIDSALEEVTKK